MLVDGFGRVHTDLRISLTDKCNLRCTYCMPAEGLAWASRESVLTDDEIMTVATVAASLGVTSVRLTGGEPLLRQGLPGLVHRLAGLGLTLSITSNGLLLGKYAEALAEAGLSRVNVSLDTLRVERFRTLSRRDGLPLVLAGLAASASAGLAPVKINAVLVRGVNDTEAPELLAWALAAGFELRFIEQMPLDASGLWDRDSMVTAPEILASLETEFTLVPESVAERGHAPAERFRVEGTTGFVGVIRAVTAPFCGACDRLRLTADGQVRNCLFAHDEGDLRSILRSGLAPSVVEAQVADVLRAAVGAKRAGHGIGLPSFRPPARPMSAIGG